MTDDTPRDPLAAPESAEEAMRLALLYVFQAKKMTARSALAVIEALKQDGYTVTLDATRPSGDPDFTRPPTDDDFDEAEVITPHRPSGDTHEHNDRLCSECNAMWNEGYDAAGTRPSGDEAHHAEIDAAAWHAAVCESPTGKARPSGDEALPRWRRQSVAEGGGMIADPQGQWVHVEHFGVQSWVLDALDDEPLATPSSTPDVESVYGLCDYCGGTGHPESDHDE